MDKRIRRRKTVGSGSGPRAGYKRRNRETHRRAVCSGRPGKLDGRGRRGVLYIRFDEGCRPGFGTTGYCVYEEAEDPLEVEVGVNEVRSGVDASLKPIEEEGEDDASDFSEPLDPGLPLGLGRRG